MEKIVELLADLNKNVHLLNIQHQSLLAVLEREMPNIHSQILLEFDDLYKKSPEVLKYIQPSLPDLP